MSDLQPTLVPDGTSEDEGVRRLTGDTSLKAAIGAFKKYMQYEGFSRHTIQAFSSDLNLFGRYLGIGQPIGKISTDNLNGFLEWLLKERGVPCSPKTYARRVTTLKVFFKWLFKGGVLLSDPAGPVIQRSVRSPLPAVLSEEEIERLRAAAERIRAGDGESPGDARPRMLLELLLQTGAKKGEVMGIIPNHIERSDPDEASLFIRYRSPAKRYKERKVPLQREWLPILDEYVAQYAPAENVITCTPRNLEYVLHDLQESAGVSTAVSFECLRWSFAVHSYLQGIEPEELRRRMGLSEITWRETFAKIKRLAESLKAATG